MRWPGSTESETILGVPVDEVIHLRQGEGMVDHHAYARIVLYKNDAPH